MNECDQSNQSVQQADIDALTKKFSKELSAGTSALVLLSILNKADKPLYGYQIGKLLNTDKQGVIYPVLRNMEAKGLLYSETQPSENGPPRKYFTISPFGKAALAQWLQVWQHTQQLVEHAISGNTKGGHNAR
ncbi:PadR family transcriptional regulator [Rheinheimera aquimaris]|uniref:PadR family transcriptional regulator n=1 Tax=Rheinheimera aquimaris TaxID=412437 RepID=UPI001F0D2383|nr:PadR family transcriptional regulator [Rheinheimera aquimaris]